MADDVPPPSGPDAPVTVATGAGDVEAARPPGAGLRAWLAPGLVVLVWAVVLACWLLAVPSSTLREQLKALQFWSLEVCLAVLVPLLAITVRQALGVVRGRDRLVALALMALAVALTAWVAPRTNRIYYDEQIYQSIGQNLTDLRRAQTCNDGHVEYGRLRCVSGEYNKQPYAYPHVLSVAYRIAGARPGGAFVVNALAMAVTVGAVYLLVVVAFDDRRAAAAAAAILALTPHQILWTATAAVEPTAALANVVAVLCAATFARLGSTSALAAALVATAWAVQFRPESILVIPVVGLLIWPAREEWGRRRLPWTIVLAAVLVTVHVAHLFAVRNEGWGTSEARFSLAYFRANLAVNGGFYLGDERFPVLYSLLALTGLGYAGFRGRRLAVALWFALFFGVFLGFYAGSYDYGADVRYSLMTYAPLAVLAGLGASQLWGALRRYVAPRSASVAVAALLAVNASWYAPVVRATTEEAWAARADVAFAEAMAPVLRGNRYVLTHNPGMFHLWGVNAGQMSRVVVDPGFLPAVSGYYAGGVYLHWNFWCNVHDVVQRSFCEKAQAAGPVTQVGEYRERDQRYVFYRYTAAPTAVGR